LYLVRPAGESWWCLLVNTKCAGVFFGAHKVLAYLLVNTKSWSIFWCAPSAGLSFGEHQVLVCQPPFFSGAFASLTTRFVTIPGE